MIGVHLEFSDTKQEAVVWVRQLLEYIRENRPIYASSERDDSCYSVRYREKDGKHLFCLGVVYDEQPSQLCIAKLSRLYVKIQEYIGDDDYPRITR